jgi:C-terminal processing protease CtpA/Prc
MIYGTATSKVFYTEQYNPLVQAYYQSTDPQSLSANFASQILATTSTPSTPINALNLSDLYVIMTGNTASASELLINGLTPYMNVFKVGTNTDGKYVASVTIQDWETNGTVNPKDPYVMQPIVVRIANSQGVTNFRNGLTPDFVIEEDIANLLPFGDPNETLLKPVLEKIQGIPLSSVSLKSARLGLKKLGDSQTHRIFPQSMYINRLKKVPKK